MVISCTCHLVHSTAKYLKVLTSSLSILPPSTIRLHVCCGIYLDHFWKSFHIHLDQKLCVNQEEVKLLNRILYSKNLLECGMIMLFYIFKLFASVFIVFIPSERIWRVLTSLDIFFLIFRSCHPISFPKFEHSQTS